LKDLSFFLCLRDKTDTNKKDAKKVKKGIDETEQ